MARPFTFTPSYLHSSVALPVPRRAPSKHAISFLLPSHSPPLLRHLLPSNPQVHRPLPSSPVTPINPKYQCRPIMVDPFPRDRPAPATCVSVSMEGHIISTTPSMPVAYAHLILSSDTTLPFPTSPLMTTQWAGGTYKVTLMLPLWPTHIIPSRTHGAQ